LKEEVEAMQERKVWPVTLRCSYCWDTFIT
jgi:hypothetical protein